MNNEKLKEFCVEFTKLNNSYVELMKYFNDMNESYDFMDANVNPKSIFAESILNLHTEINRITIVIMFLTADPKNVPTDPVILDIIKFGLNQSDSIFDCLTITQ